MSLMLCEVTDGPSMVTTVELKAPVVPVERLTTLPERPVMVVPVAIPDPVMVCGKGSDPGRPPGGGQWVGVQALIPIADATVIVVAPIVPCVAIVVMAGAVAQTKLGVH
jgi:hypothetical protein